MTDAPPDPKMDSHKPARNWRSFGKEYVIVVLGVATALAAQQAVDWWRWQSEVAQAKETIASEMARNIYYGIERMRVAGCLQSRLHEIEKILADASRSGVLPPLGQLGSARLVPWPSSAWESVVASQTATHFPRQQLALLSLSYARVQRVENWNRQEVEDWSILNGISGPSRRFDPVLGAEWQKALALAMQHNLAITNTSATFIEDIQSQNLPFTPEEQRQIAQGKTAPMSGLIAIACEPLSSVPALGGAQFSPTRLRELEEAVKRLPYEQHVSRP